MNDCKNVQCLQSSIVKKSIARDQSRLINFLNFTNPTFESINSLFSTLFIIEFYVIYKFLLLMNYTFKINHDLDKYQYYSIKVIILQIFFYKCY